ncbi:MAG: L,D-transpeptidase family protein [Coriobacteriia bacterium]|nr:L,D-transpeptidase family protein [Coriobacteriia bacterium]
MFSRFGKTIISLLLCFSLVPLAGMGFAWADEAAEEEVELGSVEGDVTEGADDDELQTDIEGLEDGEDGLGEEGPDGPDEDDPTLIDPEDDPLGSEGSADGAEGTGSVEGADGEELLLLAAAYSVRYRTHVQNLGWLGWVADGKVSGTSGRSLRLEAINIELAGSGLTGSIEYRTHVQNVGWMGWVADGKVSGTSGRSLRLEAIDIRLTGELEQAYDIYYRVHVQNLGWLGWAKNGGSAGTAGYSLRLEAIEIRLVDKLTGKPPALAGDAFKKPAMQLQARAHVQNVGWQNWSGAANGKILTAGTVGRSLRMEALCVQVANTDYAGAVQYRAHVSGIGWQGWKSGGAVAGTTGQSRQIEAVEMRLTGELEANFDIYYRAHIPTIGWLGWAKNGEPAGSSSLSTRMEALQVSLVPKGGKAPGSDSNRYLTVSYTSEASISGTGWLSPVSGGATVGLTEQKKPLEAFRVTLNGSFPGDIEYRAHVSHDGWQGWKSGGTVAGTVGTGKHIEAVRMRLTDEMASYFDIYYRTYVENYGWLGWAKNGASAGTTKVGYSLRAIQILVVVKGAPAPGATGGAYYETPFLASYVAMSNRAASMSSSTNWLIVIDTGNCILGVFSGSKGNWSNRYMWLCSPGTSATPTIKGTYRVGSRGYVFGSGYSCYYWTQISGDYLMHSVLYYPGTNTIMEGTMGVPGSHGCVRLDIQNAKWIYDNIPTGTAILIY